MLIETLFQSIQLPSLLKEMRSLTKEGVLMSQGKYLYLKVDDDYIKKGFPILKKYFPESYEPNYFGKGKAGAHISLIYPEEKTSFNLKTMAQKKYSFEITGLYEALLDNKKYYVLGITSHALIALRVKYNLKSKLTFKNKYLIDLHLTIGKELLPDQ